MYLPVPPFTYIKAWCQYLWVVSLVDLVNIKTLLSIRGRKSSAYSQKNYGKCWISQKNKAKCCISHTKNLSNVFFLLTWIYFLSPLFFWFYFLSSVSQISKISSLPRQECLVCCESHIVVMLAATILYGSRLTSKLTELNITF